jgi:hypothetical protein
VQERRVLHDQRVRLGDRLADADLLVIDAAERDDRRAVPLRAEARKRLRVLAAVERGNGQEFRRGDDALSASAVYPYLEDVPTLGRSEQPGYGVFPHPGVANY